MITLKTRRLLLAPWREEDAEALYALASDPEIGPMCGWEPHGSVEESREVIRDVFSAPEVCAILSRESGALLGAVGLQPSSEIFPELSATEQREMGYWLGRPYWGHGVMRLQQNCCASALRRWGWKPSGARIMTGTAGLVGSLRSAASVISSRKRQQMSSE
jgi:RimJ/RimL family protein N-acetyltransferase